jgi:acetyltransferase-like isoleucine patch superfamily enzyme
MLLMAIPAACSGIEAHVAPAREEVFVFWGQLVGLVPGILGRFLRRAYYRLTLERCALDCDIGFLAWFSHRSARVGRKVYIGPQAIVGTATLGDGAMIGSRASILSGAHQHAHDERGELQPFTFERAERIEVGPHAWIGEGALIMANVGAGSIVAAGAVVSTPVPDRVVVAGNPFRFVRSLAPESGRSAAQ